MSDGARSGTTDVKEPGIPLPEQWARSALFFSLCAYARGAGHEPVECVIRAGRALDELNERDLDFTTAIEVLTDMDRP